MSYISVKHRINFWVEVAKALEYELSKNPKSSCGFYFREEYCVGLCRAMRIYTKDIKISTWESELRYFQEVLILMPNFSCNSAMFFTNNDRLQFVKQLIAHLNDLAKDTL
jgi:hypothetical protein